jgi:hypothetical protein
LSLRYLNFDYAEGTDGTGTLEAVASIWPEQAPAVHGEIVQVLAGPMRNFRTGAARSMKALTGTTTCTACLK